MAREHVVFKLRITCSDDSVKELVYCKFNCDGIPDSIIQDSVGLSVVSEVEWDDAMLYKKKKRRYNTKAMQLCISPTVGNHASIFHSLLKLNHIKRCIKQKDLCDIKCLCLKG